LSPEPDLDSDHDLEHDPYHDPDLDPDRSKPLRKIADVISPPRPSFLQRKSVAGDFFKIIFLFAELPKSRRHQ
jgi:hypothetical protein